MRVTALLASLLSLASLLLASGCQELVLVDVEPDRLSAGEGGSIRITGAGFDDDTRFRMSGPGVSITLGGGDLRSASEATAIVPAAAPAGRYELIAERSGVQARLADALHLVSGEARLVFVDVGQGDATLVVAPGGETLLIDGGPRAAVSAVEAALEKHAGGRLDAVVLSHLDADHLAGLVDLLAGPDRVAGNEDDRVPAIALGPRDTGACTTDACDKLRRLRAWPFEAADVGDEIPLGDVQVRIVAANGDIGAGPLPAADDDNEHSAVVQLTFGGRTALITGDLTGGGLGTVDLETPLAEETGPVDILRVSHHGSETSSAASAIAAWQPAIAVLSLGTDNAYCHPAPDALARLAASGAQLFATGAGIVEDGARCGGPTIVPEGARFGVGDVVLELDANGEMEIAGAL